MDTDLPESSDVLAPEARKFSIFRRGGRSAVEATGVELTPVTDTISNHEALFGLENEFSEYATLWDTHIHSIDEFCDNTDISEIGQRAIASLAANSDSREDRRHSGRLFERDFEDLLSVYTALGRVDVSGELYIDSDMSMREMIALAKGTDHGLKRVVIKARELMNFEDHTPETQELDKTLAALRKLSSSTYKPIVKSEADITRKIYKAIIANPQKSRELIDTFLSTAGSESKTDRAFVTFLSNAFVLNNGNSALGLAMQNMAEAADEGLMATNFIEQKLDENGGDNILAFIDRILREGGVTVSLQHLIAERGEDWPTELREGYTATTNEILREYSIKVKKEAEHWSRKKLMHVDLLALEQVIDSLYTKISGRKFADKAQKRKTNGRVNPAVRDILAVDDTAEELREPLKVCKLTRSNGGFITVVEDDDNAFMEIASKVSTDKDYLEDMAKILQRLKNDPFGSGVRMLEQSKTKPVTVDGVKKKIYRAAPHAIQGVKVSRKTKDSRIIFTVSDGNLLVLTVAGNHKDYERYITSL